jgi:hypothetical protein
MSESFTVHIDVHADVDVHACFYCHVEMQDEHEHKPEHT